MTRLPVRRWGNAPHQVHRRCSLAAWVLIPAGLLMLPLWVVDLVPHTMLWEAVHRLLLLGGFSCMVVSALARCHLAIHAAFSAGMEVGLHAQGVQPSGRRDGDPVLRLVE